MHTVIVISAGFLLLIVCVLGARWAKAGAARGAKIFLPLWLLGAATNMWVGAVKAGYGFAVEAPIFVVVFGVPAAVAGFIWWKAR